MNAKEALDMILSYFKEKNKAIVDLVKEKIGETALTSVKDEKKMQELFDKMYDFMPGPVKIFLKKEKFMEFCNTNKDTIVKAIDKIIAGKDSKA